MNVSDFRDWVNRAQRGRKVVYATSSGVVMPSKEIMDAAYDAYKRGRVTLMQRRCGKVDYATDGVTVQDGDNHFEYIAMKV